MREDCHRSSAKINAKEDPQDTKRLVLRRPLQRPRHHQKRPSIDVATLRRVRSQLRRNPNGQSKRKDFGEEGRFRKFHLSQIQEHDYKLDITWLKDESLEDSDELPEPQDLAAEAITELEAVVDGLKEIVQLIEKEESLDK